MKIFVKAYLYKNLGDDLFIKILSDRYNNKFNLVSIKKYNSNNNLSFFSGLQYRLLNKALKLITHNRVTIEKIIMSQSDVNIVIGGSMFIEQCTNEKPLYLPLKENQKNFILGANFGPYKTKSYYQSHYKLFSEVNDICFRDTYSYNLFKDLTNARVAPDIIFSLNTKDIEIKKEKRVIISVIDCDKKLNSSYKKIYEENIIKMLRMFIKKDYKITLMSFCKEEGDEDAINSILSKIKSKSLKSLIDVYLYNGNIDEALSKLANSQIIVGTRFHANILGLLFNKTIIPIAYSDKTINVLEDLKFKGKIFDIRNKKNFNLNSLTDEDLTYKLDISFLQQAAEKHFQELDKILTKK